MMMFFHHNHLNASSNTQENSSSYLPHLSSGTRLQLEQQKYFFSGPGSGGGVGYLESDTSNWEI